MIDDIEIDVDIDGSGNAVATLILEGDFVTAVEDYLDDERAGKLRLRIPREVAVKLVKEVQEYL